jgi:hypothetical protein
MTVAKVPACITNAPLPFPFEVPVPFPLAPPLFEMTPEAGA